MATNQVNVALMLNRRVSECILTTPMDRLVDQLIGCINLQIHNMQLGFDKFINNLSHGVRKSRCVAIAAEILPLVDDFAIEEYIPFLNREAESLLAQYPDLAVEVEAYKRRVIRILNLLRDQIKFMIERIESTYEEFVPHARVNFDAFIVDLQARAASICAEPLVDYAYARKQ